MPHTARIVFAVSIAAVTMHAPARADEVDDWVETGLQLRRKREDAEALGYFRRAYDVRPTPRTRVQLALAEQALGRWIEAETDLSEALKAPGDAWIDRNRDKLAQGLETIRDHLGWLRVESQEGVELWVNGSRIGALPLEGVRVVASKVQVELRGRDGQGQQQVVDVQPRETVRLVVPFAPVPKEPDVRRSGDALPAPLDASRSTAASARRSVGWVTLGAGGLFIVEAAVAEVLRQQALEGYNDNTVCLQPGMSREQVCGYYRGRAQTALLFETAGWVAGGAGVGVGLFLLLTSPKVAPPVTVSIAPREYGVSWRGSF